MIQVLDFYADWCGPCQAMKPIFEEVENEYSGKVDFKQVDVEQEGALAAQYGVMSIPTYVVVKDNQEVDRKTGAMPKEALVSWIEQHIQ